MNKKENIKNLVKRMFLSISIMSFFVSAGVDNASAMEQNSIFGEAHKRKSDNSQQNTAPIPAPMATLSAKQDNSGYRLAVPDSPTPDPKTGVEGGSKIIVDTKEKSGNDSDFFANGENPIPFILGHYGINYSKKFSNKNILIPDTPEYITGYLTKYSFLLNYEEIIRLVKGINSNALNDIDIYNDVKRYSDGCFFNALKRVALQQSNENYAKFIDEIQSTFSDFLSDSRWNYIMQDTVGGGVEQLAEMCFKATEMVSGECGNLLWNISLLGNNSKAITYLYEDCMPSDGVIIEKKIQAAGMVEKFVKEIEDNRIKEILSNFRTVCINRIRNSMNAMLGDLL